MIVTLIGSARYEDAFVRASRELTLQGHVVVSLAVMPRDAGEREWYGPAEKVMLDAVHLRKMVEADAVLLLGDGYVGESTIRELAWAYVNGMRVIPQWAYRGKNFEWSQISEALSFGESWSKVLWLRCRELLDSGATSGDING